MYISFSVLDIYNSSKYLMCYLIQLWYASKLWWLWYIVISIYYSVIVWKRKVVENVLFSYFASSKVGRSDVKSCGRNCDGFIQNDRIDGLNELQSLLLGGRSDPVFSVWLSKVSANERRHLYNVFYLPETLLNTLRLRQNGRISADDIFKWIFLNPIIWILIEISLKFVPKGRINKIPALFQVMAWRRPRDKPLSEPMIVSLLTHICVTRPQCFNHR